jgi:hypothetical protein
MRTYKLLLFQFLLEKKVLLSSPIKIIWLHFSENQRFSEKAIQQFLFINKNFVPQSRDWVLRSKIPTIFMRNKVSLYSS